MHLQRVSIIGPVIDEVAHHANIQSFDIRRENLHRLLAEKIYIIKRLNFFKVCLQLKVMNV